MKILTFGELMLRLKTPEHLKILQADTFEASYGGAEANVAVSLATLGNDVSYVTKVPEHQVGQAAINEIRRFGVDTTRVLRGGGRVGIYYFEKGTNIRPTSVVYDRAYSAIAMAEAVVLERAAAEKYGYEPVCAVPWLHGGGSFAMAAYYGLEDAVTVERVQAHAGIDIGDVLIGMQLKAVAVPVRVSQKMIGDAHVVCARTRPKYIGGERTHYAEDPEMRK